MAASEFPVEKIVLFQVCGRNQSDRDGGLVRVVYFHVKLRIPWRRGPRDKIILQKSTKGHF